MSGTAKEAPSEPDSGMSVDLENAMSAAGIGCQVRRLRLLAGLSQHELACRSATSQPAIAHLEAGRRVPTLTTLEKLARALGHDLVVVLPSRGATPAVGPDEEVSA